MACSSPGQRAVTLRHRTERHNTHIHFSSRTPAALLGLAALAAGPARADQNIYVSGSSGEFGTLDLNTDAYTNIGATPETFDGIGFAGGDLFGLTSGGKMYYINTKDATTIDPGAVTPTSIGSTATLPPHGGGFLLPERMSASCRGEFFQKP